MPHEAEHPFILGGAVGGIGVSSSFMQLLVSCSSCWFSIAWSVVFFPLA